MVILRVWHCPAPEIPPRSVWKQGLLNSDSLLSQLHHNFII
jgi:hypothetical protein